jgi:hypothetical protein
MSWLSLNLEASFVILCMYGTMSGQSEKARLPMKKGDPYEHGYGEKSTAPAEGAQGTFPKDFMAERLLLQGSKEGLE